MVWFTPGLVLGALVFFRSIMLHGVSNRFVWYFCLLLCLLGSSVFRNPLGVYLMSLTGFAVAFMALLSRPPRAAGSARLMVGFSHGFILSVIVLLLEIASQFAGLYEVFNSLNPLRDPKLNAHNFFVAYFRPQAGMAEPAHLGIYMAFAFAIFDQSKLRRRDLLKILCVVSIGLIGSMVSIALLISYVVPAYASRFKLFAFRVQNYQVFGFLLFVVACLVISQSSFFQTAVDTVFSRLERSFAAFESGNLSGSEGSRVNSIRVVFDYWEAKGIEGLLIGEGYGNIEPWLIETYRDEVWSSMARGGIDSQIVAMILSSGLIGLTVYLFLLYSVFRAFNFNSRTISIASLFLVSLFASGGLLLYWKWQLLFVLLSVTRLNSAVRKRPVRVHRRLSTVGLTT